MSQSNDEWYFEVQALYVIGNVFRIALINEVHYMQVIGHHEDPYNGLVIDVYNLRYRMEWSWTKGIGISSINLMTSQYPDWPAVCAMQEACQQHFSLPPLRSQEGPDRREV